MSDSLKITVKNFMAIQNAEFILRKGITILAGANGSGKSQLLIRIKSEFDLHGHIAEEYNGQLRGDVIFEPPFEAGIKALWRPAIRTNAWEKRGEDFAAPVIPSTYSNRGNGLGYIIQLDNRYRVLHSRMVHQYFLHIQNNSSIWKIITAEFLRVFDKKLVGNYGSSGGQVGLELGDGKISRFGALSSGELEFISLMLDLLEEDNIQLILMDEIEAHFHPDLQGKVIDTIKEHCDNKFVLVATHSPPVMLSVELDRLLFLNKFDVNRPDENQVVQVKNNLNLIEKMRSMYGDFALDSRYRMMANDIANVYLVDYASQCLSNQDTALPAEEGRDHDMQIRTFAGILLGDREISKVVEIGAGKGRMLQAVAKMNRQGRGVLTYYATDINQNNIDEISMRQSASDPMPGIEVKPMIVNNTLGGIEDGSIDCFLLANVLHEIPPTDIADLFNAIIRKSRPRANSGPKIIIFEVSELDQGEPKYVMHHIEAIKKMLPFVECDAVEIFTDNPITYNGAIINNITVAVLNKDNIQFDDNHILASVECVIEQMTEKMVAHTNATNPDTKPWQLAFYAHNLANASAYKKILQDRIMGAAR